MKKKPVFVEAAKVPDIDSEPCGIKILGQRLEKLGLALQNGDSDMRHISDLALDAGLHIRFSLDEKTASVVNLREECDRLIVAEEELRQERDRLAYDISLLRSLTGIISASWDADDGHPRLTVNQVYGAPFGSKRVSLP